MSKRDRIPEAAGLSHYHSEEAGESPGGWGGFAAAEYMFKRVRSGHDEKLLEPNNFAHNTFFLSFFFQQGKVQQSAVRLQRDSSSCQYEQGLPT